MWFGPARSLGLGGREAALFRIAREQRNRDGTCDDATVEQYFKAEVVGSGLRGDLVSVVEFECVRCFLGAVVVAAQLT